MQHLVRCFGQIRMFKEEYSLVRHLTLIVNCHFRRGILLLKSMFSTEKKLTKLQKNC